MENDIYIGRVESAQQKESIFRSKTLQKYKLPLIVIGFGFFMGGSIALGVIGGVLSGLGTKLGMDRLKESAPRIYNWILDNPGWVELISIVAYAGAFGLTLGGVLISLVANFTMSLVLDYYAEKEGRVAGLQPFSLSNMIKELISKIKSLFITVKQSTQEGLAQTSPSIA